MQKRKKFTLTELLLIVAVMLINAAILFPVLAGQNDSARHIACENNLKDLAVKLDMYAEVNDGFLPPAWSGASRETRELCGRKTGFWFDFLARDGYFTNWKEAKRSEEKARRNAQNAMKSLICPADADPVMVSHTYSVYTSYGFNQRYGENPQAFYRVTNIANANRVPMIMDSWGGEAGAIPVHMRARVSSGYLQSGKYPAHGFNNTLFFDGHVAALRNKRISFTITANN